MSKKQKQEISREDIERSEGLPVMEVNAPAGRIQSEQQVADTMSAASTTPGGDPGLTITENKVPSQVVHTTKVAELLKSAKGLTSGGSVSGPSASMRVGSYSGNDGNIIGDMSSTTQLAKSDRSPTRTGKKLDSTLKHINYLYNEQVSVKYDESKPLAENPAATQGYNGTYRNEHARTQKQSGFVPGELYYDRSVDEIHQDFIYPVMGQTINDPSAKKIKSYDLETSEYADMDFNRGNHMHTSLNITFDANGAITAFAFGDLNATPDDQDYEVANISAVNGVIDANTAELDRQNMDANAGDELSPKFNPLPRSIADPTNTIALLRDIEASTGSEVFMAYKKSALAMSYQLNKAAKDGQRIKSPMWEMISGCMADTNFKDTTIVRSITEDEADTQSIFTKELYKNGAASLIIHAYDSIGKYNTKGDLLLQPRGFRMHLQTADNSMDVLRVPKKFVDAVNTNEVFSTIDYEYDPFLPVCISDKASLAHPYSFNTFIENGKPKSFNYMYANNSNNRYITQVYHPLVKGLYDYFTAMGSKYASLLDSADRTIKIPCLHSTTGFSLWSLVLLAATPYIIKARLTSFIDVFDYEENFGYPFSQLISIKEANPMYSKNYVNNDYNEPITVKQMIPAVAFKWVFPETYWINREYTDNFEVVLPWYHNQEQYEMVDGVYMLKSGEGSVMSMPSIRSGSRFGFFDTIYGMEERDVRLCLDRQTVYPAYKKNKNDSVKVYKYGKTTDGQPVIEYDNDDFTFEALIKTPREIGYVIPAPNGMLTQLVTDFTSADDFNTTRLNYSAKIETHAPGYFRIRYWQGIPGINGTPDDILSDSSINVNRAMSLQQQFKVIVCQRMVGEYREYTSKDIITSLAALFDATSANPAVVNSRGLFKPFTVDGTASTDVDDKQVSLQKYFWTRLQRLPFAINPFDCSPQKKALGSSDAVHSDPYDFIYIYGCAGFRASDYNEDSYNREKERLNLGMLFVKDPYFNDSPLYRG